MGAMKQHIDAVTMESEIDAAVEWWVKVLRDAPPQDNGDAFQSALSTTLMERIGPYTDAQLAIFESSLRTRLAALIDQSPPRWDQPDWGSYGRTLATDYGPMGILAEAASGAGMTATLLRFPVKTVMWVNPGRVSVCHGYRAAEQVIYERPTVAASGTKADGA